MSALLTVAVPEDAVVYVNGYRTRSTGARRRFVSTGLQRGESYGYEVRAEIERDGKRIDRTRVVSLSAGRKADLTFEFAPAVAESPAETVLALNVPAEAKVELAGQPTTQVGMHRVYVSQKLEPGQVWQEYKVRVTLDRGGQELTREQTVTLTGGQRHELTIDFDQISVASR